MFTYRTSVISCKGFHSAHEQLYNFSMARHTYGTYLAICCISLADNAPILQPPPQSLYSKFRCVNFEAWLAGSELVVVVVGM